MTAAQDTGFTLIETLIAMAVLAVGGVTLLTAVESHANRVGALTDRIAARWVAENELAALQLGLTPEPAWRQALGQDWRVTTQMQALDGTALRMVILRVGPSDAPDAAGLVELTGFLPAAGQ